MTTFYLNNKKFYIDARLKLQLDKKVIPDLKRKDKDAVFVFDGEERGGKSVCSQTVAAYLIYRLDSKFDLSNICMHPSEFRKKIESAVKNQVVIYDEAHRGMGSAGALSEINRILKDLIMEMGQKNLCVFVVLPTFFSLEKYVALFRARGLFHVYERKGQRGFWVYYNKKNKLRLYMRGKKEYNYNCMRYPNFRGRFLNQYVVDEQEYRKKKKLAFKTKPRLTKIEVYKEQRDKLVYILHELHNNSIKEVVELFKFHQVQLKKRQISNIIAEIKERSEKGA